MYFVIQIQLINIFPVFSQLPDPGMVDSIIIFTDELLLPFGNGVFSFFICNDHLQDIFSYAPGFIQFPVLRQLQMHLEAEYFSCLKNCIIKFHMLKCMQRIMMYEILQCLLRRQVVLKLMQNMVFIKMNIFYPIILLGSEDRGFLEG